MVKLKKLIINADDFGYTTGISYGIIEAFEKGVVTSTTALSVSKQFLEAMKLAKLICPKMPIGLHLTLTLNKTKPILPKCLISSLSDEDGFFWDQKLFLEKVKPEEVYLEWEAQLLKFLESGKRPTHLDSHHNVHGKSEAVLDVILALAKKYNLPIRNPSRSEATGDLIKLCQDVKMPDRMLADFYGEGATMENLELLLDSIQASNDEIFEINVHPALLETDLIACSSYSEQRIEELRILTSPQVKEAIVERDILLCNYEILKRS